ncbi:MAG: methionine--tRNA ligase, partial [Bifidobacteriaceae bacterium]|nr:methionine--tRNA ligase [Bifidobacteriaceae bacterium]
PHSSQKIHEALGGTGIIAPLPRLEEVDDLDKAGFRYPIITGTYVLGETVASWRRENIVPGTPIAKPTPVFAKIPREAVQKEIDRFKTDLRKKKAEKTRKVAANARAGKSATFTEED